MFPPGAPAAGEQWSLLLDVDGTLLEIAPTPDAVKVPDGLVDLLASLRDLVGGALALVSGRPVAELDGLFGPERFPAAGVHGAELRQGAHGPVHVADGLDLGPAHAAFEAFAARHPGTRCENKGAAVTLHYRQAPELEADARQLAEQLVAGLGPAVELLHGKMVVELRTSGATKGRAVASLLAEPPFAGRVPVYVGDDVTDEDAFAEVDRRDGLSVAVGERPSRARYRLAHPADVRRWLVDLSRALREQA